MMEPGAMGRIFSNSFAHIWKPSTSTSTLSTGSKFTLNTRRRLRLVQGGDDSFGNLKDLFVDEEREGLNIDDGWLVTITNHHGNGLVIVHPIIRQSREVGCVEVCVREGDKVKEGTVVARLEEKGGGGKVEVRACVRGAVMEVNERLSGEGACELVKNDGAGKGWICIIRGGANGGGKKRKKDNGKGKREDKGKDNGVGGGGQPDTKKARTSK